VVVEEEEVEEEEEEEEAGVDGWDMWRSPSILDYSLAALRGQP